MGGCASKPKESDLHPDSLPSQAPASPKKAEPETIAQENTNGGENQNEAPLVDLSEPTEEAKDSSSESKVAHAEPVLGDVTTEVKPATEDKVVEAIAPEDKQVNDETKKPSEEAEVDKSDDAPPFVTM
ncbi:hypothetical protein CFOL_v3_22633 [Cephalotus follicularis]|uniref:Uncharacterized protein n=1 Tax=Cephalotus follicularis TaxID=3775 RepID=A0A1Q3CGC5_CEPFO|nr:hypothetical protein CFOL_v3_22633 [Cephalotus follicularis]